MNALNAAIVEAQQHDRPAESNVFAVMRDQVEANPFTDEDVHDLKSLVVKMNERQERAVIRAKLWRTVTAAGGLVALAAELVQAAYLVAHFGR